MKTNVRKMFLGLAAAVAVVGLSTVFATPAKAQWGIAWHTGSVHLHRTYHPTSSHWTPGGGFHTHGHYDYVPHFTPGHFDVYHNGHLHGNPYFHH